MKRVTLRLLTGAVKTVCIVVVSGCICVFMLAFKAPGFADDLLKQLGIPQNELNINIDVSMESGYLQYNGAKNAKNILLGNRVAVVNELVAYAKKYTNSAEFKKEYARRRSVYQPKKPELSRVNVDSIRAAEKHRVEESIKQTQANANDPNPKIRNAVPYRLETLNKELAELDKPDNKKVQQKAKQMQDLNDLVARDYAEKIKKIEEKFPENPQVMVKKRLQDILDLTADVDFNAEIKHGTKYDTFVNPEYEKKSKDWKLAFRAGKAATDAVRAAAEKWMAEIR